MKNFTYYKSFQEYRDELGVKCICGPKKDHGFPHKEIAMDRHQSDCPELILHEDWMKTGTDYWALIKSKLKESQTGLLQLD